MNAQEDPLQNLMAEVQEQLEGEWSVRTSRILDLHRIGWGYPSVPLAAWKGIAQAIADASGFHVVLRAEQIAESKDQPGRMHSVGARTIAELEPSIFVDVDPL